MLRWRNLLSLYAARHSPQNWFHQCWKTFIRKNIFIAKIIVQPALFIQYSVKAVLDGVLHERRCTWLNFPRATEPHSIKKGSNFNSILFRQHHSIFSGRFMTATKILRSNIHVGMSPILYFQRFDHIHLGHESCLPPLSKAQMSIHCRWNPQLIFETFRLLFLFHVTTRDYKMII